MTYTKLTAGLTAAALALSVTACDDDDPIVDVNEEELITTVTVVLNGPSGTTTLRSQDLDGDGGNDAVVTGGTVRANTPYTYAVSFTDETETPAEDVTAEVREEDEEHQVFFEAIGLDSVAFAYGDEDDDGNPVGLAGTLTTGPAGTGDLRVVLRHEPNKDGEGVSEGDLANADGETDVDVRIPLTVE